MKVLVTGANGFVGKNLCAALRNIAEGKDIRSSFRCLQPLTIYEHNRKTTDEDLSFFCSEVDFVFNLVGVNRTDDPSEFLEGNYKFEQKLLSYLEKHGNNCPIMLSSSIQANLTGRFADSAYGKSKLAGEELLFDYANRTGANVYVYRFPNLYGKWCRPKYNSVVATFCDAIANNHEYVVDDRETELELLYIDDLVDEMLSALTGNAHRCNYEGTTVVPDNDGRYCFVHGSQKVTLGEIDDLLQGFKRSRSDLYIPEVTEGSFSKKLYSTYLTYLDPEDFCYSLKMNIDSRGSFTELFHTVDRGQFSINVSKPGVVKGQHWHHTKWEKFCVVSGEGLIQLRRVGCDDEGELYPVHEYRVCGDDLRVVEIIPGYTHNIINLSDTRDLVTVMWCNENYDSDNPDTFYCEIQ